MYKIASGVIAALCCGPELFAASASTPPSFEWPVDMNEYRQSAGFDLDQSSGARADWSGWRDEESATGTGHAYDTHNGIDIGMATGTPFYSTQAGSVDALRESVPNDDHSDTGNYLQINHYGIGGSDWRTFYWHLEQNGVIPCCTGNSVVKSQLVGYSNNTGNSTGPHLHYSIAPLSTNLTNDPFYHGWWQHDEFYFGDARMCLVYLKVRSGPTEVRGGNSTSYAQITTVSTGTLLIATQHYGWWRVMIPEPPARVYQSRDTSGQISPTFSETAGTWVDSTGKTSVSDGYYDVDRVQVNGSGTRKSLFGGAGQPSTPGNSIYSWNVTQKGSALLYASWPADANAKNVTYRISSVSSDYSTPIVTDVVMDQKGIAATGTGTKVDPYNISVNPYVANHTTVGAPDEWDTYSPSGSGIAENGPENLYKFTLSTTSTVSAALSNATTDVDVQILSAPSPTSCIARGNISASVSNLAPGTYYITVDSFGTSNSNAGPYTLTVTFPTTEPFANTWMKLGKFYFNYGQQASVEVLGSSVNGKPDTARQGALSADSIKLETILYRRTGWIPYGAADRIETSLANVGCVLVSTDATDGTTRDIDSYAEVKIHAGPVLTATSQIVGKAVTGQRFVCTNRSGDWYKIKLPDGCDATEGWIAGDNLVGYFVNSLPASGDPVIDDSCLY